MAAAAFTPGPWMAASAPSSVVGWPIVGSMGRSICNVSWMPRKVYPNVSDADYAAFSEECEANARLIAAAPELLFFAKEFVVCAKQRARDGKGALTSTQCADLFTLAFYAVRKAEGGAP